MRLAVWLIERPRWFKRTVLIINDLAMLTIALWLAYSLRLSQLYVPDALPKVLLMAAAPVIGVVVFYMRGLYKLVTRFIGPEGTTRIYIAVIIAAVLWALVVLMSGVKVHPRSVIVIYGLIAAGLIRSAGNGPALSPAQRRARAQGRRASMSGSASSSTAPARSASSCYAR